jgi:hypothetical protein
MEFDQSNSPSFLNLEIQKSINEAIPTFDSYFSLLDKINQDIRGLESFLLAKGITTEARRCFYDGDNSSDHVEWSFDEGSGKFRLLHSVYTWEKSGDSHDSLLPGKEVRKLKSKACLIESPTDIRVRSFEALPNLIRALRFEIDKIQESFQATGAPAPQAEPAAAPEAETSSEAQSDTRSETKPEMPGSSDLHRILDS